MSNKELGVLFEDLSKVEQNSDKSSAQPEQPVSDQSLTRQDNTDSKQYDIRDELYSKMLEHYLEDHKSKSEWNKRYKFYFFWVTIVILIALVGAPIAAMVIFALRPKIGVEEIALVVSGIPGIISAIMILPKIIAEHLFPANEDQHMIGMVQNMQKNDAQIRNFIKSRRPLPNKLKNKKSEEKDQPKDHLNK